MSWKQLAKLLVSISTLTIFLSCSSNSLAPSRGAEGPQIESIEPDILKQYDAFYIPDIEVYSVEGDVLRRVNQKEVEDLARKFRGKLIHELDSRYTMFSQPARNVALIKIALSDVSTTYALLQLTPGFIVPNAMRGGASIEATVIDSISGTPVLRFRDTKQGDRQGFLAGLRKWDGVQSAFDEWAVELKTAVSD